MEAVQVPILGRIRAFLLIAAFVLVAGVGAAPRAAAQGAGCAPGALSQAQITIDAPAVNEVVSGTVTVRGSARVGGIVGQLNRVEVALGSVTKAQTFDGGTVLNFNVSLDVSSLPAGSTSLRVTTCGPLAWGEKSTTVNVAAPAVTTTTVRATTTTVAAPASTIAGATSTSVTTAAGAGAGAQAGGTTSTRVATTVTTGPATIEAPPPAVTTTVAPRAGAAGRNTPLVLTETPPKTSSGPPVWVGVVVGISGGLGLLFSARPWRRRTGGGLLGDETAEQDLVSTK